MSATPLEIMVESLINALAQPLGEGYASMEMQVGRLDGRIDAARSVSLWLHLVGHHALDKRLTTAADEAEKRVLEYLEGTLDDVAGEESTNGAPEAPPSRASDDGIPF